MDLIIQTKNSTCNGNESGKTLKNKVSFDMIIDVLSAVVLNQMREEAVINQDTSDLVNAIKGLSFKSMILE